MTNKVDKTNKAGETVNSVPILKGVELSAGKRGRRPVWPFNDLEVGEAFPVPSDKVNSLRTLTSKRNAKEEQLPEGTPGKRWTIGFDDEGNCYVQRTK